MFDQIKEINIGIEQAQSAGLFEYIYPHPATDFTKHAFTSAMSEYANIPNQKWEYTIEYTDESIIIRWSEKNV